jgi:hypothetical protein
VPVNRAAGSRVLIHMRTALALFLTLLPATGAAKHPGSFGTPVHDLRLGLELPETNVTGPCGGLCGLSVGSRVAATFLLRNQSKQSQKLAFELTCSGHELSLEMRRPLAKAASRVVSFGKSASCRANAPIYKTIAAGATERVALELVVPDLSAAVYEVTARALIVPERGKSFMLRSAALERAIHR